MATIGVFCLVSLFSLVYGAPKGIPAIIWSTDKSSSFPDALTGHSISADRFQNDYLQQEGHNMLFFMQDKLSMEDFTQHADVYNENSDGAAFHNLKVILESHSSTHVPSLSSASSLLESLKDTVDKVHTLKAPYKLQDIALKDKAINLIVVELPSTAGLHVRKALKQIDAVILSVHDQMKETGKPFTAVYTAKASSKPTGPNVGSIHGGRHLLQNAEATNSSFWNVSDGCLYVYVQSLTFEAYKVNQDTKQITGLVQYTLPATIEFDASSNCANGTATRLVVKYANLPAGDELTLTKFEFTMDFTLDNQYWTLTNLLVTYEGKVKEGSVDISGTNEKIRPSLIKQIFAPSTYSYHCSYQTPFRSNTTETQNGYYTQLRAYQLQMQVNGKSFSGEFGQVNDCIGFFTIPIWSAIITMAVLLMVFFFGVCMLAQVDTQDRFDDPKGKTIQVNVNE